MYGEVVAFTIGDRLSADTYDVHFEKAYGELQGAYAMINREFARWVRQRHPEVKYLNREDDMGVEGLRKAKESYYPDLMVEKYAAVMKHPRRPSTGPRMGAPLRTKPACGGLPPRPLRPRMLNHRVPRTRFGGGLRKAKGLWRLWGEIPAAPTRRGGYHPSAGGHMGPPLHTKTETPL